MGATAAYRVPVAECSARQHSTQLLALGVAKLDHAVGGARSFGTARSTAGLGSDPGAVIRLWARALGASSAPEAMLPAPRASRRRAFRRHLALHRQENRFAGRRTTHPSDRVQ
jgi:hypothetical protein